MLILIMEDNRKQGRHCFPRVQLERSYKLKAFRTEEWYCGRARLWTCSNWQDAISNFCAQSLMGVTFSLGKSRGTCHYPHTKDHLEWGRALWFPVTFRLARRADGRQCCHLDFWREGTEHSSIPFDIFPGKASGGCFGPGFKYWFVWGRSQCSPFFESGFVSWCGSEAENSLRNNVCPLRKCHI